MIREAANVRRMVIRVEEHMTRIEIFTCLMCVWTLRNLQSVFKKVKLRILGIIRKTQ